MVPDLPFLLSIAALSGSLAGLAGLVGGLRRGEGLRPIDRFRVVAAAAIAYLLLIIVVLFRRMRVAGIRVTRWLAVAGVLDTLILLAAVATLVVGTIAALQVTLLLFLARPMTAFLFVLASFDVPGEAGTDGG